MKSQGLPLFLAVLLFGILAAAGQSTNVDVDCLSFKNGDMIFGHLLEIQPGQNLRWQHPDSTEPIDFKPDGVAQIDFPQHPVEPSRANDSCKLWLANGDMLEGKLAGYDHDTLTLNTWYAGQLKFHRRSLQTLEFNPHVPLIFDGLTGLDGWTQGNAGKFPPGDSGQWSYRNGAFYADKPASVARDLKLPDRAQMQFDMAWKGTLNIAIALYTDSLQPILLMDKERGPDFGGFYSLKFQFLNTVNIALTPIHKKGPLTSLGDTVVMPSLAQKEHAHVDLRMSKPENRVALFLDGTLIKDWKDPNGFAGEGTGVRFVNNPGAVVKLSNFRVAKWNGALDNSAAEAPDPSHDVVMLESASRISGAVTSITNGQILLATIDGPATVKLTNAGAIEFAHYQGQAPAAPSIDTHATFVQGGGLTFQLLGWRPDGVSILSPDFGQATFAPSCFGRLQFLSAQPKADAPGN